jgi:hypothetical protein
MSWTLDSRATPNQAGIFAGRSLPKLPLVRFREHVARSSLSPFLRRFLLIFPGYLFSSPLLHLGCLHYSARMRLLLPHRCFIPLLSRALLPFAPAHNRPHSSVSYLARRRAGAPDSPTPPSRAPTPPRTTFSKLDHIRTDVIPPPKLMTLHKHGPTPQTYKGQRVFEWVLQNPPLLFFQTTPSPFQPHHL